MCFVVENGKAVSAGLYNDEPLDWDMRATKENWEKWAKKPLTMASIGIAVATGKVNVEKGDLHL